MSIFMPPLGKLEHYLDLLASIEHTAGDLDMPVLIDGYAPPLDWRLKKIVFHFLFVCRPDSHPTLYEWVADFDRLGPVGIQIENCWLLNPKWTRFSTRSGKPLLCSGRPQLEQTGHVAGWGARTVNTSSSSRTANTRTTVHTAITSRAKLVASRRRVNGS